MANYNINEELNILEETKEQIKQAIIDKGQSISSSDSFRSYASKIEDIETGIDTSDATATDTDLVLGKTAYVNGQKITGSITELPADAGVQLRLGWLSNGDGDVGVISFFGRDFLMRDGSDVVTLIPDATLSEFIGLTADKLKIGETILGIEGTLDPGIDTSDATATASDIKSGKVAYVKSQRILGDADFGYKEYESEQLLPSSASSGDEAIVLDENNRFMGIYRYVNDWGEVAVSGTVYGDDYDECVAKCNHILGVEDEYTHLDNVALYIKSFKSDAYGNKSDCNYIQLEDPTLNINLSEIVDIFDEYFPDQNKSYGTITLCGTYNGKIMNVKIQVSKNERCVTITQKGLSDSSGSYYNVYFNYNGTVWSDYPHNKWLLLDGYGANRHVTDLTGIEDTMDFTGVYNDINKISIYFEYGEKTFENIKRLLIVLEKVLNTRITVPNDIVIPEDPGDLYTLTMIPKRITSDDIIPITTNDSYVRYNTISDVFYFEGTEARVPSGTAHITFILSEYYVNWNVTTLDFSDLDNNNAFIIQDNSSVDVWLVPKSTAVKCNFIFTNWSQSGVDYSKSVSPEFTMNGITKRATIKKDPYISSSSFTLSVYIEPGTYSNIWFASGSTSTTIKDFVVPPEALEINANVIYNSWKQSVTPVIVEYR